MRAAKEKSASHSERFLCIGDYGPPDAERLLQALCSAHVVFEIECDDGIRRCGSTFGSFGDQAKIRVWIDPAETKRVTKIQTRVFGEV
jgi:hypothetical protein